jgi:phosphoglycerate dehydrogenase-like enzyme
MISPSTDQSESRMETASGSHAEGALLARPKAIYLLGGESYKLVYHQAIRDEIAKFVEIVLPPLFSEELNLQTLELSEVEVIFSGWNAPLFDQRLLDKMPKLKAIFYAAGSIRYCMPPAFWERNILVSSAYAANAVPVAEYTMGAILLSLKRVWHYSALAKQGKGWGDHTRSVPGAYHSKVGLISCGTICRQVIERLHRHDLDLLVSCPFLSETEARRMGVQRASLEEIFSRSDVVSVHTPSLPETRGMLGREHFSLMKQRATLINTSRGDVLREKELIEVAGERPDLAFVLDVTHPEPPAADSALLRLPNVFLTPHLAGSMGDEIERLGEYMLAELKRYLAGKPLRWRITAEAAAKMA